MRKPRRNHSAAFKARAALEAIRGEKTVAQIAFHHGIHPGGGLEDGAAGERGGDVLAADGKERIRELQAKVGQLTMENDF